jgi:hypothetical protein
MKKIFVILSMIPAFSYAEIQSVPFEVVCDDTTKVTNTLRNEYNTFILYGEILKLRQLRL